MIGVVAATDTATTRPTSGATEGHARLERIFAELDAPFALVDLDAMWWNAREMLTRGGASRSGWPASRCAAGRCWSASWDTHERFRGLMTFTLAETLWLRSHGFDDLLLAYPTADRAALAELGRVEGEGRPIVMVDSVDHLDLIASAAPSPAAPVRVCIEFDTGFHACPRAREDRAEALADPHARGAAALAREIVARPSLELAGVMGYEGHIAGVGDRPLGKPLQGHAIRRMQRASAAEIAERRAAVVAAMQAVAPISEYNTQLSQAEGNKLLYCRRRL